VLRSVDGETKGKFQLKARDDGLLLHQLWLVVSQTTTTLPSANDPRTVSFQLLQALIDGNTGSVLRRLHALLSFLLRRKLFPRQT
jgi:hypothetical protein